MSVFAFFLLSSLLLGEASNALETHIQVIYSSEWGRKHTHSGISRIQEWESNFARHLSIGGLGTKSLVQAGRHLAHLILDSFILAVHVSTVLVGDSDARLLV